MVVEDFVSGAFNERSFSKNPPSFEASLHSILYVVCLRRCFEIHAHFSVDLNFCFMPTCII